VLPGGFDRVLLDAPCSGEGLFRRNPAAAAQWRPGHVPGSAERQRGLLADAARLVRPGGVLVYSTCTFAPEENEQQVARFLTANPGWELLQVPLHQGFAPGRRDWAPGGPPELTRTVRLWPHHLRGEGHFIAKLVRPQGPPTAPGTPTPQARGNPTRRDRAPRRGSLAEPGRERRGLSTAPRDVAGAWREFVAEALEGDPGDVTVVGERAYVVPDLEVAGAGVRLVRPGLLVGRARPGRFEPAHALGMAAGVVTARRVREVDDDEAAAFVRGETLASGGAPGWTLVSWNGWPLGWGRAAGGVLKNHYPKGLRTMRPAHA
jgi:NOL1/NOP2/fmu family ribosome biogenesis protein